MCQRCADRGLTCRYASADYRKALHRNQLPSLDEPSSLENDDVQKMQVRVRARLAFRSGRTPSSDNASLARKALAASRYTPQRWVPSAEPALNVKSGFKGPTTDSSALGLTGVYSNAASTITVGVTLPEIGVPRTSPDPSSVMFNQYILTTPSPEKTSSSNYQSYQYIEYAILILLNHQTNCIHDQRLFPDSVFGYNSTPIHSVIYSSR